MGLRCVTPSEDHLIDDETARLHCRVDTDDELLLVKLYRDAAERDCLNHTRRGTWLLSTWEQTADRFPGDPDIRYQPIGRTPWVPSVIELVTVNEIRYIDANGVEQTLDPADYKVDTRSSPGRIVPAYGKYWPVTRCEINAVTVEYTAGYASPDKVPAPIRAAVMLRLGTLFANREDVVTGTITQELPEVLRSLLSPYVNRWGL